EDDALVERLRQSHMTLTVCPLSNLRLGSVRDLRQHPLKRMLEQGLRATVNSDDPAYFGGYLHDHFVAVVENLQLSCSLALTLVQSSCRVSCLDAREVDRHLRSLKGCGI